MPSALVGEGADMATSEAGPDLQGKGAQKAR
jgi:hypothetical protein